MSEAAIEAALQIENRLRCQPPLSEEEVAKVAKSIATYPPGGIKDSIYTCPPPGELDTKRYKSVTENVTKTDLENDSVTLAEKIKDWISGSNGWWGVGELDAELNIVTALQKTNRRVILYRLRADGVIEQHQKQNKLYRRIDRDTRMIDFKTAGNRAPLNLRFPFGIERLVNIYPKNIIILAGAPNAGKTAWLLNFIKLNMSSGSIYYYSSEMGDAELALRLGKLEGMNLDDWNFKAEERCSNYADVIRPDCVNIVDFLEIDRDFNEIAGQIRQIYDRLSSGIAIVTIQKNPGVDLGRGGTFSLEKARLYLSMDIGMATITKAKNWVNSQFNPNRLKIQYKIVDGCKFIVERDWFRD
jgi:hypothetical protein